MFFNFTKEGPPVLVQVYVGGRAHAATPKPCSAREIILFKMFLKGCKDGEIGNIPPGRYHWNFTKVSRFKGAEAELIRIED